MVRLGWCGIVMQAEAIVPQPANRDKRTVPSRYRSHGGLLLANIGSYAKSLQNIKYTFPTH